MTDEIEATPGQIPDDEDEGNGAIVEVPDGEVGEAGGETVAIVPAPDDA